MERSDGIISLCWRNVLLLTKQDLHLELAYQRTGESNNVIGDINADWKAGLNTSLQKLNLSFLLDKKGGDAFLDMVWLRYRNV
jgi:hypothetical protein